MVKRAHRTACSLLAMGLLGLHALARGAGTADTTCEQAGLSAAALGLCTAYCEVLDCSGAGDDGSPACRTIKARYLAATGQVPPCEQKICEVLAPALFFERIARIDNPEYTCYSDSNSGPYEYVEYIVGSAGEPQIGLGMEDQFDGTWYAYYFEYQDDSDGQLPEFFRYDITPEQVSTCRRAFEPPFSCSP